MTELVSIIIPVYNGSNYLREAIDSVLRQTYEKIEIVIVNDGSNDGGVTEAIATSYKDRVKYYYKENGGVGSALNFGILKTHGEYISWLSHDDLYYQSKIEEQVVYFERLHNKRCILYSYENIINSDGKVIDDSIDRYSKPNFLFYELLKNQFIGGCSLLIPRQLFNEIGLFNEKLKTTQDYDLWFRALIAGYTLNLCPIVSGASRHHPAQESVWNTAVQNTERDRLFSDVIQRAPYELIAGNSSFRQLLFLNNLLLKYTSEKLPSTVKAIIKKMITIKPLIITIVFVPLMLSCVGFAVLIIKAVRFFRKSIRAIMILKRKP